MTTIELKNKVISKINQLTDDRLLMEVYQLLGDNSFDIETIELSENHKFAINTAIHQIESGDFLTNEQANKEALEWLNK